MTDLGMNERAWALADRGVERAGELRIASQTLASGARVIDAGVNVPGGLGAGLTLAQVVHGRARRRRLRAARHRRRDLARRPGVDRSSGRVLHGVAVRGLGDQPRRVLRDGLGAAAREGARREGAVCEAWLCRGRLAGCPRARDAHAADRRGRRVGGAQSRRAGRAASPSSSRRRPASPAAFRSSRVPSRPGSTRWTRSGSTSGAW